MRTTDTAYREVRALIASLGLCPTEVIACLINEWSDGALSLSDIDVLHEIERMADRAAEDATPAAPQNGDGSGVRG